MSMTLVRAFQSERLKTKGSLAGWMVVVGAFFTPAIVAVIRVIHPDNLHSLYAGNGFWTLLWRNSWESMAIFFLPMIAILATSLVTQIEYRNNAWKQVHVLPIHPAAIFFSKYAIALVMVFQLLLLFNIGIYLSAVIPWLLIPGVPYPPSRLPFEIFAGRTFLYFVDVLPIVALQYSLSLHFKSFLVPIGVGFLAWVASLAAISWKSGYVVPYIYTMLDYLKDDPAGRTKIPSLDFHWLAIIYFLLFTALGYVLFIRKAQKG